MIEPVIRLSFVASRDPESNAIKLFERGWPSHVDAVLPDGSRLGARLDGGVQVRPAGYEKWAREEIITLPGGVDKAKAWMDFLIGELGKPYDSIAIAAFPLGEAWHTPGHWICSGLQSAALVVPKPSWLPRPMAHPFEEVTPFELWLITSPWRLEA